MRNLALQAAGWWPFLSQLHTASLPSCACLRTCVSSRGGRGKLLRMVWQASTVDWIAMGALLIAAPMFGSETARQWVVAVAVVIYGYAAVGNGTATRGRHVGWCLMLLVVALALLGR
jgi:hypothetical protein